MSTAVAVAQLHVRRAQPSEAIAQKHWIAERHYLKSAPPGFVHVYEFTLGGALVGGAILGRPGARQYDPEQGHEGTIYEADGWCPLGLTDGAWGHGWNSRKGRRDQRVSKKRRWVRTP